MDSGGTVRSTINTCSVRTLCCDRYVHTMDGNRNTPDSRGDSEGDRGGSGLSGSANQLGPALLLLLELSPYSPLPLTRGDRILPLDQSFNPLSTLTWRWWPGFGNAE